MSEKRSWQETLRSLRDSVNEGLDQARRVQYRDTETAAGWPPSGTMIVELCEALGSPVPDAPLADPAYLATWEKALEYVRRLKGGEGQ